MSASSVFCHGENSRFPIEDFRNEGGALIHSVRPEHYAATGALLRPPAMPGLVKAARRGNLAEDRPDDP